MLRLQMTNVTISTSFPFIFESDCQLLSINYKATAIVTKTIEPQLFILFYNFQAQSAFNAPVTNHKHNN